MTTNSRGACGIIKLRKSCARLVITSFAIFIASLINTSNAQAACSAPTANAGKVIYNKDYHVSQYCDGSNWVSMGKKNLNYQMDSSPLASVATGGNSLSVWAMGSYIYLADDTTLKAYTFDGVNLTLKGSVAATTAQELWGNGDYLFLLDTGVTSSGTLNAYTFNGTTFTLAGSIAINVGLSIWGDANYVYVERGGGSGTLEAYSFNGTTFTLAGSIATGSGSAKMLSGDGTYIFLADDSGGLRAYTFNGTTFTLKGNIASATNQVWSDGTYVYSIISGALHAYTFDGTTFTSLASVVAGTWGIGGDGTYIYAAESGGVLKAFTFNGTAFTLHGTTNTAFRRATTDGKYLYTANSAQGLKVFNNGLFPSCTNPAAVEGTIQYNADLRILQSCNGSTWQKLGKDRSSNAWGMQFSGTNYLVRGADMTGSADLKTFTSSFWVRRYGGTGAIRHIYDNLGERINIYFDAANKIHVTGKGTGGGTTMLDVNGSTAITDGNWHHIMMSFDMNNAANRFIYLDGAAETLTVTTYTNNVLDFTRSEHTLGTSASSPGTSTFFGDIADFWLAQRYIDLSVATNRTKFRTTSGLPADLGSTGQIPDGTSPLVYIAGKDPDTWNTNKGTGGNLTATGVFLNSTINLPGLNCSRSFESKSTLSGVANADNIWSDGTYYYLAKSTGLSAYTFDGTNLTLVDSAASSSNLRGVQVADGYIYVTDDTGGSLKAYTFNGTAFTLKGTVAVASAYSLWVQGSYIYVSGTGFVYAYTFDGTSFTLKGTVAASNNIRNLWGDGTYLYVPENSASTLKAYTFNGTTFSLAGSLSSVNFLDVWGDGTYIYAAHYNNGIQAYTFDGATFTLKATAAAGGGGETGVWGDGTYVYLITSAGKFNAYTFDGTNFKLHATFPNMSNGRTLYTKGGYVFAVSQTFLTVFSTPASSRCSCSSPLATEGEVIYNNDHNVLQYCNGSSWVRIGK